MCVRVCVHTHSTPSTQTLLPSSFPISKKLSSPSSPSPSPRYSLLLLFSPQSVLLQHWLCRQDFVPMRLPSNQSRMQTPVSRLLMCDFVGKRQRDAGRAAGCREVCPAEQSRLGTCLNSPVHLCANTACIRRHARPRWPVCLPVRLQTTLRPPPQ